MLRNDMQTSKSSHAMAAERVRRIVDRPARRTWDGGGLQSSAPAAILFQLASGGLVGSRS